MKLKERPLRNELESFVNACLTGDSNIFATDGEDGLKALGLTLDLLNKAKVNYEKAIKFHYHVHILINRDR